MKALGWDDEIDKYIRPLKEHLKNFYNINLEITDDETEFIHKFNRERWDFVVLDLLQKDSPAIGEEKTTGASIAKHVSKDHYGKQIPIFMITNQFDRLDPKEIDLPHNAILKSKSTHPGWMAGEIFEALIERGVYVDKKKAFLIYGHDRSNDKAKDRIEDFLSSYKIGAEIISGENLSKEIIGGLIEKMRKCAAIIAICTPDDEKKDGTFLPRANVLLEIGMAMGLARGIQRLTIVQKWGANNENQSNLPSDLGGLITIRYENSIIEIFEELKARLIRLGLSI